MCTCSCSNSNSNNNNNSNESEKEKNHIRSEPRNENHEATDSGHPLDKSLPLRDFTCIVDYVELSLRLDTCSFRSVQVDRLFPHL